VTPEQFAARADAMPWRRWACGWDACDCYGLVVLYWREVLGIDPGPVPQTDIAAGFAHARGWAECGPEPGTTAFMSWHAGRPSHCGILLPGGMLLHAQQFAPGSDDGSVRMTRLAAMARLYPALRFYRYTPP
jgi:cell wall-associated NlpC family hydrolase